MNRTLQRSLHVPYSTRTCCLERIYILHFSSFRNKSGGSLVPCYLCNKRSTLSIVDMYSTILRLCYFLNNCYAMPHLNVSFSVKLYYFLYISTYRLWWLCIVNLRVTLISVCVYICMYIMRRRNSLSQRAGVPGCSGPKKTIQYNGEIRPLGIA